MIANINQSGQSLLIDTPERKAQNTACCNLLQADPPGSAIFFGDQQ